MNRIAIIMDGYSLYWSSIIITIAAAVAVCTFLAVYLRDSRCKLAGVMVIPVSIVLSLALARLVHWYCRPESYLDLTAAMTDPSGGYALTGVFAGCFLAAVVVRILRLTDNLPRMLDCMSIAGAAAIAVGRLASFFNTSGRGLLLRGVTNLPWTFPVINAVTGQEENRLATFLFQAVVTGLIFLMLVYLDRETCRTDTGQDGDACLLFLLCYGASQVVLDSTRYDSLYFRSNGFVSMVQVLGAMGVGLAIIVFSVRLVRSRRWKNRYLLLWLLTAVLLILGGYMEYHVQRHASEALFAYSVMTVCLLGLVDLGIVIRYLAEYGGYEP